MVGCVRHGRRAVAASTSRQALPVQRDASAQQLSVQICRRETQRRPQHQGTFRLLQCSASYVSCQRATARICCCCAAAAAGHPTPGSNRLVYLARGCSAANPPHAAAAVERWDRQTGRLTDTGPLYRPCSAYYASVPKISVSLL